MSGLEIALAVFVGGLVVALRTHRPGDAVYVNLVHNGKPQSVRLTLSERPKDVVGPGTECHHCFLSFDRARLGSHAPA